MRSLWACLCFVVLVLTTHAEVQSVVSPVSVAPALSGASTQAGAGSLDEPVEAAAQRGEGPGRDTARESGAFESEVDDEDPQSDAALDVVTTEPLLALVRDARVFAQTQVEPGHLLVSTGLARGPPTAG